MKRVLYFFLIQIHFLSAGDNDYHPYGWGVISEISRADNVYYSGVDGFIEGNIYNLAKEVNNFNRCSFAGCFTREDTEKKSIRWVIEQWDANFIPIYVDQSDQLAVMISVWFTKDDTRMLPAIQKLLTSYKDRSLESFFQEALKEKPEEDSLLAIKSILFNFEDKNTISKKQKEKILAAQLLLDQKVYSGQEYLTLSSKKRVINN